MGEGISYYKDLTPYSYLPEEIPANFPALNVGWLERGEEFPTGSTSDEFAAGLIRLIKDHPRARTRGWHSCSLPHGDFRLPYPLRVEVDGQAVTLGAAEVRLIGADQRIFIAPDLIYHYVIDHQYLPPKEFVEAVLLGHPLPEIVPG